MTETSESAEKKPRDYAGAKLGMWLFLLTELFLFFGPFTAYSAFRYLYSGEYAIASQNLNLGIGSLNTVILITSSLTMALSIAALRKGSARASVYLLIITIALGTVFLGNKYFEWSEKISHGLYPGSSALGALGRGHTIFYGLYFFMTGLHAIHVLAGVVLLTVMAFLVGYKKVHALDHVRLENSGLYWHLVDVIWIYLFPLFYLVR